MSEKKKIIVLGSCVSRVSMLDGNQSGHGTASEQLELCYFLDKQNCLWRRRSRKSRNFFDFGQKFPLPQFCKYGIRFEFGLGTVFSVCHISGTHLI